MGGISGLDTVIGAIAVERTRSVVAVILLTLVFKVPIKRPETTIDSKKNGYQKCQLLTGIHKRIGPRIGLFYHAATPRGSKAR